MKRAIPILPTSTLEVLHAKHLPQVCIRRLQDIAFKGPKTNCKNGDRYFGRCSSKKCLDKLPFIRRLQANTFCSWISFYTGRPNSMSKQDFDIPLPDDSFLVHLTRLIPVMTDIAERFYQSKPLSSMSHWKTAMTIYQDLKAVAASVHNEFGIHLESFQNVSAHGPRETMMVTSMSSIGFYSSP